MKFFITCLSLGWGAATAIASEPSPPALQGSCQFVGHYASGCIEFLGEKWTVEEMESYCVSQSKAGEEPQLNQTVCERYSYNSRCSSQKDTLGLADMYVNHMPAFVCENYMEGSLSTQPEQGWPMPEPEPEPTVIGG